MRTLGVLLLLGPLAGCVLLVPSYDPGEHCSFAGETECAKCMRTSCQTQIDACCGVSACRESAYSFGGTTGTTLGAVDKCAAGDTTCGTELARATKSPQGDAVSTCVTTACKTPCAKNAAPVLDTWSCATARTGTNECSQCIYDACAVQLNDCCGDSGCAKGYGLEENMAACVGQSAPDCVFLSAKDKMYSGGIGAVRKCIVDSCEPKCFGNSRPHTSCTLQSASRYCTCSDASSKSGDECSKARLRGGGARCFVTDGGCVCGRYECKLASGNAKCECKLEAALDPDADDVEATTCNSAYLQDLPGTSTTGGGCCLAFSGSSFNCSCTSGLHTCGSGERAVNSCDRSDLLDHFLAKRETDVCSQ